MQFYLLHFPLCYFSVRDFSLETLEQAFCECRRHEWHGVTGWATSLNIHFCTITLWICEKLLTDSIGFCQFRFLQHSQCCIYGYEHASVLFLHGHTSTDAVRRIALLLGPVGNRNPRASGVVLNLNLVSYCPHPRILLDYFVSWVWCTDLYQVIQSVTSVDLMQCLLLI